MVYYHYTPVFQAPHNDFQALRNVALDQTGHALASNANELIGRESLGEKLPATEQESVDVLHDDAKEAVLAIGKVVW